MDNEIKSKDKDKEVEVLGKSCGGCLALMLILILIGGFIYLIIANVGQNHVNSLLEEEIKNLEQQVSDQQKQIELIETELDYQQKMLIHFVNGDTTDQE
jgi:esterase/lipase